MAVDASSRTWFLEDEKLDSEFLKSTSLFSDTSVNSTQFNSMLPTPPQSPEHLCEGNNYDIPSMCAADQPFEKFECTCQYPIVRDCMWSANLSVRIPDLNQISSAGLYATYSRPSYELFPTNSFASTECSRCVDIDTLSCVDTCSVFNCVAPPVKEPNRRTIKKIQNRVNYHEDRLLCTLLSGATTTKEEPTSDYDEWTGSNSSTSSSDDDLEIDVESISNVAAADDRIHVRISRIRSTLPPLIMPATLSMSAQVAAMHNYSSTVSSSGVSQPSLTLHHRATQVLKFTSHAQRHRSVASAPQSPVDSENYTATLGRETGRLRVTISNPCSPSESGYCRRKGTDRHAKSGRKRSFQLEQELGSGSGSADDSEGGDVIKKALHNVLERKRRNNLKEYFNDLRREVPALQCESRSSKVIVLQKARDFVREIRNTERENRQKLTQLMQWRETLLARLDTLNKVA